MMASHNTRMMSSLCSVAYGTLFPVVGALLISVLLGCGGRNEEPGASDGSSQSVSMQRMPLPPKSTPLVSGGVGTATSVVGGATTTVAVDRRAGKGEFLFEREGVKLEFGKGELPEDFPTDIPFPEDGKITTVLEGPGISTQVLVQIPTAYDLLRSNYVSLLTGNGWLVTGEKPILKGRGVVLQCEQGERTLSVTLKASGQGSTVMLVLGAK